METEQGRATGTYVLVLYWDVNDWAQKAKVRAMLAKLLPSRKDSLHKVMDTGRLILKRKADPEKDQHIVDLWKDTGAQCRFERKTASMTQPPASPVPASMPEPSPAAANEKQPPIAAAETRAASGPEPGLPPIAAAEAGASEAPAGNGEMTDPAPEHPQSPFDVLMGLGKKMGLFLKGNTPPVQNSTFRWMRRIREGLVGLVLVFAMGLVLEIALLYTLKAMWMCYISTPLGVVYLKMADTYAPVYQYFNSINLLTVAMQAGCLTVIFCLLISVFCQFFHITRFFYAPYGLAGKLLLWVVPISVLTGWQVSDLHPQVPLLISAVISFVPVAVMHGRTMATADSLVPELGTLIFLGVDKGIIGPNLVKTALVKKIKTLFPEKETTVEEAE